MTPNELEALVKDLNVRVDRVEHILPTLATKQDLAGAVQASEQRLINAVLALEERLRTHMGVLHDDSKSDKARLRSQMLLLHEEARGENRLLAEHLADIIERLDRPSRH